MLFSVVTGILAILSLASGIILQNGQVRETKYLDTNIDLEQELYETFDPDTKEIHYMGRWDSQKISWWAYVTIPSSVLGLGLNRPSKERNGE